MVIYVTEDKSTLFSVDKDKWDKTGQFLDKWLKIKFSKKKIGSHTQLKIIYTKVIEGVCTLGKWEGGITHTIRQEWETKKGEITTKF